MVFMKMGVEDYINTGLFQLLQIIFPAAGVDEDIDIAAIDEHAVAGKVSSMRRGFDPENAGSYWFEHELKHSYFF